MTYIFSIIILACGYYSLTYGISLWKNENNRLGGFGAIAIAAIGTIIPIIVLFLRQ